MVRLQQKYPETLNIRKELVSIPLWFDYNNLSTTKELFELFSVSIPLWFDYNYFLSDSNSDSDNSSLNSTMVRLQLLLKNKDVKLNSLLSQFHYGSITTEYDAIGVLCDILKSQFHYGSITTQNQKCSKWLNNICLNSTMVRLQQNEVDFEEVEPDSSQFHYGSITTVPVLLVLRSLLFVSIPLWFDYNYVN